MNWIQIASTIVLAGAAIGIIVKAIRWLHGFISKIVQFLDDWAGEPERPGISAARPGVLERLHNLETSQKVVEHEVKPNQGMSIKDQINRIEQHVVPEEVREESGKGNAS